MKKIIVLAILPAIMALSGCSPKTEAKENVFFEDTLMHEELFAGRQLQVRKAGVIDDNPEAGTKFTITPKIGVQYSNLYDADTHYAIRIVAAIGDITNVTATWNRSVLQPDNTERTGFTLNNDVVVTTAYQKIDNGGGSYSLASNEGDPGDYSHYVVYTLYNLPADDSLSGYYLFANLTLSRPEAEDAVSKTVITELKRVDARKTSLPIGRNYFMKGSINGETNKIIPLDADPDTNHAKGSGISLLADDKFGVYKMTASGFTFLENSSEASNKCYDTFCLDSNSELSDNYSKVRATARYSLFVNGSDEYGLYIEKISVNIYLNTGSWEDGGSQTWGNGSGERFAISYQNESGTWGWINMDAINPDGEGHSKDYCASINLKSDSKLIICRMNKNQNNGWNNDEPAAERVYNQTPDIVFNSTATVLNNKFTITSWHNGGGDWNKSNYSRSSQSPITFVEA